MGNNNNQRIGAKSNAQVGSEFEKKVQDYFNNKGIELELQKSIPIGLEIKKNKRFDLGNDEIIIECKSHTWTKTDNVPSAKLRNWSEAMYCFHLAPKNYKKYFIVEMSESQTHKEPTLLCYYLAHYGYLIPKDVILGDYYPDGHCEFYKFDDIQKCFAKYYD